MNSAILLALAVWCSFGLLAWAIVVAEQGFITRDDLLVMLPTCILLAFLAFPFVIISRIYEVVSKIDMRKKIFDWRKKG